ncbi:MAG: hypothetical protein IKP66_04600 [Lachnospiraceae bacterium]|nr:hypothetical protein [Lachnospiraceae bacterium]
MNELWLTEGESAWDKVSLIGLQYGGFTLDLDSDLLRAHIVREQRKRELFIENIKDLGVIRADKLVQYISKPIPSNLSCFTNTAELIRG